MIVDFNSQEFSPEKQGELDNVLHRITAGTDAGAWNSRPDRIYVNTRLSGGRSGCEVLDVVLDRGTQQSRKVVKIGNLNELRSEYRAFRRFLTNASSHFVRIEATTKGVVFDAGENGEQREAIVYDHASRFAGNPNAKPELFGAVADAAIQFGGPSLARANRIVHDLFDGVRNDLYEKYEYKLSKTTLHESWNQRLDFDGVLRIDRIDVSSGLLEAEVGLDASPIYARDFVLGNTRTIAKVAASKVVLDQATVQLSQDQIFVMDNAHNLRFEIEAESSVAKQLRASVSKVREWTVRGALVNDRLGRFQSQIDMMGKDFCRESRRISGPHTQVRNPISSLSSTLNRPKYNRIVGLAHGDLNPNNIVIVEETPLLIDFSNTKHNHCLLIDFACLECCIVRSFVANRVDWRQLVILERLLALASCGLPNLPTVILATLHETSSMLAHAFSLLWTIRWESMRSFPSAQRADWCEHYTEQLFLYAISTFKWPDQGTAELRASAAVSGVASEWMSRDIFRDWGVKDLSEFVSTNLDGLDISAAQIGRILASLSRRAHRSESAFSMLDARICAARDRYVAKNMQEESLELTEKLRSLDETYIDLEVSRISPPATTNRASKNSALNTLLDCNAVVLLGGAGTGKSTVAREWQFTLANRIRSVANKLDAADSPLRFPLLMQASDLARTNHLNSEQSEENSAECIGISVDELTFGAVAIGIDGLNELPINEREVVAKWIRGIRQIYPRVSVFVCHRSYGYDYTLLPFSVVLLKPIATGQSHDFVRRHMRVHDPDHCDELSYKLINSMMDRVTGPKLERFMTHPLMLWMMVERFRHSQEVPPSRAKLFEEFSSWALIHSGGKPQRASYAEKSRVLGILATNMVARGLAKIQISELDEFLKGAKPEKDVRGILEECITNEMLVANRNEIGFRHQSFQEYFSAQHVLKNSSTNLAQLRRNVWKFGWHDTFALLLSFGGEHPEITSTILMTALQANELLTARFLAEVELPDHQCESWFINYCDSQLRDEAVGEQAYLRSAKALAVRNTTESLEILFNVAEDVAAPTKAITATLTQLSLTYLNMIPDDNKLVFKNRFSGVIAKILNEKREESIVVAAINASAKANLEGVSGFAFARLIDPEVSWTVRKASWDALHSLAMQIPESHRRAFTLACANRITENENELYTTRSSRESVDLLRERKFLLGQIAEPEYLSILLSYRYRYGCRYVKPILARVLKHSSMEGEKFPVSKPLLLCSDREREKIPALERLNDTNVDDALATIHVVEDLGSKIPLNIIESALENCSSRQVLCAVARAFARQTGSDMYISVYEKLRKIGESLASPTDTEAFISLFQCLTRYKRKKSKLLGLELNREFFRGYGVAGRVFPWRAFLKRLDITPEDLHFLFSSGETNQKLAIHFLHQKGFAVSQFGALPADFEPLSKRTMKLFRKQFVARAQRSIAIYANAAVGARATGVLSPLLQIASSSTMRRLRSFEKAALFRAVGFLVWVVFSKYPKQKSNANRAIEMLKEYHRTVEETHDREVICGLATALMFVGDWRLLLSNLDRYESLRAVATNAQRHWLPTRGANSTQRLRELAGLVTRELGQSHLHPETRSIMEVLKSKLENRIGEYLDIGLGTRFE